MTSYLFVQSTPTSTDVEEQFDRWYDEVHIPEVVATVAGVARGTRHVARDLGSPETPGPRRRLTIYELDNDDVAAALASLGAAMRDGSLQVSELIDREVDPPVITAWSTE